jgi:predicted  nucleic acid-binding Zn-ribbon protein
LAVERVTVDRKEFEAFLADNQALLERVQGLVARIDELQNQVRKLESELRVTKERKAPEVTESTADKREAEESIRLARRTIARLMEESKRRVSK